MNEKYQNLKVCLDSRLVKLGEYFIPIKGESFDGHKFVKSALEKGAAGIIEESELYELATHKLQRINPMIIAVTGSVGKSTMTNFLKTLLSVQYKTCLGNLNTKLGLATNIINDMNDDCEMFIAECGMDRAGELLETSEFIAPDIAVIVNISESHMEKLGSLEAIKKAKMELTHHLKPNGRVFVNWDNENIRDAIKYIPEKFEIIKYGENLNPNLSEIISKIKFEFIGLHNYLNILGAAEVGLAAGLTEHSLIKGLEKVETPKGRLKIIKGINGSILIDDTYNSSPVSCSSAIKSVSKYFKEKDLTGRKIAILGGMLELGDFENEGHEKVGYTLIENNFDDVILVGELAKKIFPNYPNVEPENLRLHLCENSDQVGQYVVENMNPEEGDIILIKGSQGIRLERAVKALMQNPYDAEKLLVRQDDRWK